MDEFEVYLVSNGSMQLYPSNTLSSFTNHLMEPLQLDGEWRVALSAITVPANVKNVTKSSFIAYTPVITADEENGDEEYSYLREIYDIDPGLYENPDHILEALKKATKMDFDYSINAVTGKLTWKFKRFQGFSFRSYEIPNILGFEAVKDFYYGEEGIHVGFKSLEQLDHFHETFELTGDYPVDITGGRNLFFVYINIIEYQNVADSKAPLLRMMHRPVRIKNGSLQHIDHDFSAAFKDLEYKRLLTSHVQSIKVELRNSNGELVPFYGTGQSTLTLKFKRLS